MSTATRVLTDASRATVDLRRKLEIPGSRERRCGIEHEFTVVGRSGVVDFGRVVNQLPIRGRRLDPDDPNARRLAWGGVLTVDGREAEIVTPPIDLVPGAAARVAGLAARGTVELAELLEHHDDHLRPVGYSTHLNVAVDDRRSPQVARTLVRHFSPALMLMMDRQHSPGVLIRPRRGRMELAGEHVEGDQLRAALTFFAGTVAAATDANPWLSRRSLPASVRPSARAADQRYGWYIDRSAFGPDLYASGRDTVIETRHGDRLAGSLLEESWSSIRPFTARFAGTDDIDLIDSMVAGDRPLPLEAATSADPPSTLHSPHGSAIRIRNRPGITVEARYATWDTTIFQVIDHLGHNRYVVNIPDPSLERFLALLDSGQLDTWLHDAAVAVPTGRVLASVANTREPGVFDRVLSPSVLSPEERDLQTGRVPRPGRGGAGRSRDNKPQHGFAAIPPTPPRRLRVIPTAAIAAMVVIFAAAMFVATKDDGQDLVSATAASTVPDVTSTIAATLPTTPTTAPGPDLVELIASSGNSGLPATRYTVEGVIQPLLDVYVGVYAVCTPAGCVLSTSPADKSGGVRLTGDRAAGSYNVDTCLDGGFRTYTFDLTVTEFTDIGGLRVPKTVSGSITDSAESGPCGPAFNSIYSGRAQLQIVSAADANGPVSTPGIGTTDSLTSPDSTSPPDTTPGIGRGGT